nr:hypothetical protein REQ54_00847 [Rhizobium sp. Q54]
MTERLFIGNDSGTFKLRVSKPGVAARSAAVEQCLLHEQMQPLTYVAQGYITIGGGGGIGAVSLGMSFSYPPVVILRCASNRLPGNDYRADLNLSTGVLSIQNNLGYTDTFKYVVFIA